MAAKCFGRIPMLHGPPFVDVSCGVRKDFTCFFGFHVPSLVMQGDCLSVQPLRVFLWFRLGCFLGEGVLICEISSSGDTFARVHSKSGTLYAVASMTVSTAETWRHFATWQVVFTCRTCAMLLAS